MQNLKLLIGVMGGTLVLVLAIAILFTNQQPTENTSVDTQLTEADRRHVKVETMAAVDENQEEATLSAEATPSGDLITIVEFSDLQCPACRASQPVVDKIVENNPGKVELVYRHFPLESIHQNAKAAAISSEIVAEQGLFWEYVSILFENQTDWATEGNPVPLFIEYAQEIGADTTDFENRMSDKTLIDLVEADIRDGYSLGINATPTFFVEGEKVNTNQLSAAITARL